MKRELVLDLVLNWSRPWTLKSAIWVRTYLVGSLEIPIDNAPEAQPIPRWSWPDTIVGGSSLSVPDHFDQTLELIRRAGGTQVYRFEGFRKEPLTFFEGISVSGRLSWLEKETERLEAFLSGLPEEVVRVWNQEIEEAHSRIRSQGLDLSQDRRDLLLALPFLIPIELELRENKIVLLFRGREFPAGQNPLSFALEVAPELSLLLA